MRRRAAASSPLISESPIFPGRALFISVWTRAGVEEDQRRPCRAALVDPVHLRHMLEQPWPGHPEAALLVAPTLGPHVTPAASSMRSSVESPIKTPIGLSTFEAKHELLRVETSQDDLPDRALFVGGSGSPRPLTRLNARSVYWPLSVGYPTAQTDRALARAPNVGCNHTCGPHSARIVGTPRGVDAGSLESPINPGRALGVGASVLLVLRKLNGS